MASSCKTARKAMGSRKVESFASHLFYFIWNELEGGIPAKPQKCRLEKGQHSDYTPEIGKMVLKMQIDFRDDLQELFSKHLDMRMDGSNFFEFVKSNLKLLNPTDVFDRTCASCAFFSEFALYHFTRQNKDYLEMAPITWSNFFHKNLRGKFNIDGGWTEFQKRARMSTTVEGDLAEASIRSGIERLQIPEASASIPSQVTSKDDQSVPPGDVIGGPSFEVLPLGLTTKILKQSPKYESLKELEDELSKFTREGVGYIKKMKFLEESVMNPNIEDYFLEKLAKKYLKIDISDESEPNHPPSPVSEESVSVTSTTFPSTSDASEHQGVKPKSGSRTQKTSMPAIRDPRTESRLSKEALRRQLLKYFSDSKHAMEQAVEASVRMKNPKTSDVTDTSKTQKTRKGSQRSHSSKKSGRR